MAYVVAAQNRVRTPDEIARDFNQKMQAVHDEIDSLEKTLEKGRLSLTEAAALREQQNKLRRTIDQLWTQSQGELDQSFSKFHREVANLNLENRRLEFESAIAGSQRDLLNNVEKFRDIKAFEGNVKEMGLAWDQKYGVRLKVFGDDFDRDREEIFRKIKESYGIDLKADGYGRQGTSNPYTGQLYYKYYDPSGALKYAQWLNDQEGWSKYRNDLEKKRRRLREEKARLQDMAKQSQFFENELRTAGKSLSQSGTSPIDSGDNPGKTAADGGNNVLGVWHVQDALGNRFTLDFRSDGTVVTSNGSASAVWKWTKTNEGDYFVNSGSSFRVGHTYRIENGRLVSNGGNIGTRP
jgi:predicted DNA-binding protein YlxM (UPF0122 family)